MMRWILTVGLLLSLTPQASASQEIFGFRDQAAAQQLELERKFDSHIDAGLMRQWMQFLTQRPHHAGSPKAKENAEWMAERLREWGFETRIEIFHVLIPHPQTRELTLTEPERWSASLTEGPVEGDSVAEAIRAEGLPPYNSYSADGDVTAELVYVNQGLPRDYEELERRGIDVRGKIVLARYGGSWRGIKPKVAAEKGALGCIIFNDPLDDGFFRGAAYPNGAFKHERAVQRGSVLDLPKRPGDPLTPGYGATKDAPRLSRSEADNVMRIPVLPISYADALPFMRALGGPVAPRSWRGAMPVTYRIGPGPAKVRLHLEFSWDLTPAYNVIATLPGSSQPDQWVIRGNHHDAWVVGALDPISGAVALLGEARAVGLMAQQGWRPQRSLVYALWDAEEPALLGSTEWVEHHAEELRRKAVAYINTDGNSRGFLSIGGSHALERLANQSARQVDDPQTEGSVAQRLYSRRMVNAQGSEEPSPDFPLSALGSGSDYSAFLQHLGLPTLNLSFGGESPSGEYHTMFDTFDFYTRYIDPQLDYSAALAKLCGRLSLRLANAHILPFDFQGTSQAVSGYVSEVMQLADQRRREVEHHNKLLE
ncbi:MAG: M28 family peptidase, partial [Acidobacteriota bacterium]